MARNVRDRGRQGRPPGRRPGEQRPTPIRERVAAEEGGKRPIPPVEYQRHLEGEHGLRVVAEPGWPGDVKRYRLVRPGAEGQAERSLAAYTGTRAQALAHFYQYLHPVSRAAERPARPRAAA